MAAYCIRSIDLLKTMKLEKFDKFLNVSNNLDLFLEFISKYRFFGIPLNTLGKSKIVKTIIWTSVVSGPILFIVDRILKRMIYDKEKKKIQKELNINTLKIDHLLTFGISSDVCNGHKFKEFDCGNLDCNYGRLSYILNFINNSKKSLDVCIYIITAEIFGEAIIESHKRGVKVRVIADSDMSFSAQSYINNFRKEEVPLRQKMSPYIMHHKFIIVDDEIVINGSMNFTMTGVFCNWENVVISSQPHLVCQFVDGFQALWDDFAPDLEHSPIEDPLLKKRMETLSIYTS